MSHMNTCVKCGKGFVSQRKGRKCCSRKCLSALLSAQTSEQLKQQWRDPKYRKAKGAQVRGRVVGIDFYHRMVDGNLTVGNSVLVSVCHFSHSNVVQG
jgi:hypothetical protein